MTDRQGSYHFTREAVRDVDVGVIYTHERRFMSPLLSSLSASGEGLALGLVLVDNASREGTGDWLRHFPHTTVIRNERRLGYAANLNRILCASSAPYVLLVNTDMYFAPGEQCLSKMVQFMGAHTRCGISVCRIYHPDGSYAYPARRFQTPRIIAARRFGLAKVLARSLDEYLYKNLSRYESFDCDWVSGCFMFVRREAFDQVGYFDCRFQKYFEDVDICLRMARAGWQVMFHGGTYCFHHEQRASRRIFSRDARQHLKSYLRWLGKWGLRPERFAAPLGMPLGRLPATPGGVWAAGQEASRDRAA